MEAAPSDPGAEPKDPRWVSWLIVITLCISALAIAIGFVLKAEFGEYPDIFDYLYIHDEPAAAWLSALIVIAAVISANIVMKPGSRVISKLAREPQAFIVGATLLMAAGAVFVYRKHPIAMDEYAPLFQAGAFARGRLTGQVPPDFVPRLIPADLGPWFLKASSSGQIISTYWPGFAFLLTPFVWLGCPWLLNPILGGLAMLALWSLARRVWPDSQAAGWTLLLTAASPGFVVNAFSYYSMTAHMLCSICFTLLLLEPTPRRAVLAGLLGSFALILHNPLPHTLYAIPWILHLASRGRLKVLCLLFAGYLPITLLVGGGWVWLQHQFDPVTTGAPQTLHYFLLKLLRTAFASPKLDTLNTRVMNFIELSLWAVPLMLPLACIGARTLFKESVPRLLVFSALITIAAYFFVAFDQGHGWGYRYIHSVWFILPMFAAALITSTTRAAWIRQVVLNAALASMLLCNGLRFIQVRSFIDRHLAQIPQTPNPLGLPEIVFVNTKHGYFTIDLVQDDPFLKSRRQVYISQGEAEDARFARSISKDLHLKTRTDIAAVWRLESSQTQP